MANKLSTSEILAAARAAGGRQPKPQQSVATGKVRAEVPRSDLNDDLKVNRASELSEGEDIVRPDSMRVVLESIRESSTQVRTEEVRPPELDKILKNVRQIAGSGLPEPPSISKMLCGVREESGDSRPKTSSNSTPRPEAKVATRVMTGRPSTAEILAAARKSASPSSNSRPIPSSTKGKPGQARSTVDILAAARKQGAGTGSSHPMKKESAATAQKEFVRANAATSIATVIEGPAPVAVADVLQAVRKEAADHQVYAPPLPPLAEMIRELRRIELRPDTRRPNEAEQAGWTVRFQRWFHRVDGTHQGASI